MASRVIPPCVGIGLRTPHAAAIAAARPAPLFLEVHAENYMAETPALDRRHLARFRALIDRLEPALVSEHLAWSAIGGAYLNDLLPLPYTEESLDLFCRHVMQAQEALGRRLLIENPSTYLRFAHSTIGE